MCPLTPVLILGFFYASWTDVVDRWVKKVEKGTFYSPPKNDLFRPFFKNICPSVPADGQGARGVPVEDRFVYKSRNLFT